MEFGTNEPFLAIKKIKGERYKGLYELKINQSKIFYFINKFSDYVFYMVLLRNLIKHLLTSLKLHEIG